MSVQRRFPPSASSAWQSYTNGSYFIQRFVRPVFRGLLGIPTATLQSGKGAARDISLRRALMINRAASFRSFALRRSSKGSDPASRRRARTFAGYSL